MLLCQVLKAFLNAFVSIVSQSTCGSSNFRRRRGQNLLLAVRRYGLALDWRQCRVGVGARVAFDAAADAVQVEVKGGKLRMGRDDLADPPRIEYQRVFARQAGAALAPQFAPKIAALQRMHVLLQEGEIELQDVI